MSVTRPLLVPYVYDRYTRQMIQVGSPTWCSRPYLRNLQPVSYQPISGPYQPRCSFTLRSRPISPIRGPNRQNPYQYLRGGMNGDSKDTDALLSSFAHQRIPERKTTTKDTILSTFAHQRIPSRQEQQLIINEETKSCSITVGDWVIVLRGDNTWRFARVSTDQSSLSKRDINLTVQVEVTEEPKLVTYIKKAYPINRVMVSKNKDAFIKQFQNVYYNSAVPNAIPYKNALDHYFLRNGGRQIDEVSRKNDYMTCTSFEK